MSKRDLSKRDLSRATRTRQLLQGKQNAKRFERRHVATVALKNLAEAMCSLKAGGTDAAHGPKSAQVELVWRPHLVLQNLATIAPASEFLQASTKERDRTLSCTFLANSEFQWNGPVTHLFRLNRLGLSALTIARRFRFSLALRLLTKRCQEVATLWMAEPYGELNNSPEAGLKSAVQGKRGCCHSFQEANREMAFDRSVGYLHSRQMCRGA